VPAVTLRCCAQRDNRATGLSNRLVPPEAGPSGSRVGLRECAWVAVAAATALVLVDALVRDEAAPKGDDLVYEKMAQAPFEAHSFPFAYRILVPWLVHVLPFGHTFSFSLLAWLCSGAAAGALYALLRRLGLPQRVSVASALVFVLSPPLLVASLRQGRSADPVTVLVLMLGVYFIVDRRPGPLAVTMALGALNRESALFLAPLAYACWADRPIDWGLARRVGVVALPAAAVFVALRLAIPTVGRDQVIGYDSLLGGRWTVVKTALEDPVVQLRRLFTVYGPFWLLAPLALPTMRYARRGLVLVALAVASMLFALDWARMILLAAPVFYGAAVFALSQRRRLIVPTFAIWIALIAGYAVYMHHTGVRKGLDEIRTVRTAQ